ncbi:GNAT family N-acetyltransferase [Atlantibacter sp.]|uniref:GNAT family N-acetyltransferase n=1 Tax=Atlantibacter sp. TaxID=1903473 RepID=UPI0028AD17F5|nr:GNAT family N-acetyltransferase [Atlantibacter sp.]
MRIRHISDEEIVQLHQQIPELFPIKNAGEIMNRTQGKETLALAAQIGQQDAGYLLGYWTTPRHFYYWLGGVKPAFRRQGIGEFLLKQLEQRVLAQGGNEISVKSMNRYPAMLILLIRHGYQITAVTGEDRERQKIHFSKHF